MINLLDALGQYDALQIGIVKGGKSYDFYTFGNSRCLAASNQLAGGTLLDGVVLRIVGLVLFLNLYGRESAY